MTEQDKADKRAAINTLLVDRFGPDHGCHLALDALFRVDGNTTVRFMHEGQHWDLISKDGTLDVAIAR